MLHPAEEKVGECLGGGERRVPFGERHSYLCWGGRIPLVHLAVLGENCLLRTSVMKTGGGGWGVGLALNLQGI